MLAFVLDLFSMIHGNHDICPLAEEWMKKTWHTHTHTHTRTHIHRVILLILKNEGLLQYIMTWVTWGSFPKRKKPVR
jgi:hypothetical protein